MYLGIIAALAIGIGALGTAGTPAYPDAEDPIRVVSVTHEIEFPNRVTFTLEAESDAEIAEVTLFYRLGRQNVVIYGYPEFSRANRIVADFVVNTGGSDYIPSGADIEYYYVIQDASGETLRTESFRLEYRDPRYSWETFRLPNLTVLYHDRPIRAVEQVARDVDRSLEDVKELLGLGETLPMKAVILNDAREAARSFPFISRAATQGHVFGGFAYGEYDMFVLVGLSRNGMVHEMTHLLIDEALSSPLASIPSWLNEGLAMYFESGPGFGDSRLRAAARSDDLMRLRSMNSVPGRPSDIALFYSQARSVVEFMAAEYGRPKLAALLRTMAGGRDVADAAPEVYGLSLDELEAAWRDRLLGISPSTSGSASSEPVETVIKTPASVTEPPAGPGQPDQASVLAPAADSEPAFQSAAQLAATDDGPPWAGVAVAAGGGAAVLAVTWASLRGFRRRRSPR